MISRYGSELSQSALRSDSVSRALSHDLLIFCSRPLVNIRVEIGDRSTEAVDALMDSLNRHSSASAVGLLQATPRAKAATLFVSGGHGDDSGTHP